MVPAWLLNASVVVATILAMELVAATVHRFVMHGWGWAWHRSHHEPQAGRLERNDLFALVFGALSLLLFVAGRWWPILWWVALGMLGYGLLYGILHDGLVHRRFPFVRTPRNGYIKRLVQAHRLHHAVREKDGAVSFGFLYAPPIAVLRRQLRGQHPR
jgi:beta-carotene 3-hydroxylase